MRIVCNRSVFGTSLPRIFRALGTTQERCVGVTVFRVDTGLGIWVFGLGTLVQDV